MKVIDVLNMWANDEDVKVKDEEEYFASIRTLMKNLNSEIEIIEDTPKEDKKIEKLEKLHPVSNKKQQMNNYILRDKINEIIDRLNGDSNE